MKHYSYRTEKSYIEWIKRDIFYFYKRHPREMGEGEIVNGRAGVQGAFQGMIDAGIKVKIEAVEVEGYG
jgi:hypothetical protein